MKALRYTILLRIYYIACCCFFGFPVERLAWLALLFSTYKIWQRCRCWAKREKYKMWPGESDSESRRRCYTYLPVVCVCACLARPVIVVYYKIALVGIEKRKRTITTTKKKTNKKRWMLAEMSHWAIWPLE